MERLEIIWVDCGSTAEERAHIDQTAREHPALKVIHAPYRLGLYQAWNVGIHFAAGDYIVNSNVDDITVPEAYEVLASALNNGADVAYGNWWASITVAPMLDHWQPWLGQPDAYPAGTSPYGNFPVSPARLAEYCHWSCGVMWRKALHERVGYFDPSFGICGDYDMWCRMVLGGAVVEAVPYYLGWFHFSPEGGNISFANEEQFAYEWRRVQTQWGDKLRAMEVNGGQLRAE